MYKSSGKKYNKKSKEKYAYASDGTYSDEDVYDGESSPEYYSGNKTGTGFYQASSGHGKSNNYYSNAKSHDYYGNNYLPGVKPEFFMARGGKHGKTKEPSYKMNKYQTIVLKVQIHCDACIRKVKKAIADIDGVESISVDQKQKKVTVTGYIDPKKVLKKVAKTGKSVELMGSKDNHPLNHHISNKTALMLEHPLMNTNTNKQQPAYTTVEVNKASRGTNNTHASYNVPQYVHMTPQVRNDVDYMFSDDNAHNCSIM